MDLATHKALSALGNLLLTDGFIFKFFFVLLLFFVLLSLIMITGTR